MDTSQTQSLHDGMTIADVLRVRGELDRDRDAYRFLRYRTTGPPEEDRLTYGEILTRARTIAATLQQHCIPASRVLILAPPGLDYISGFFGCLLAGFVAVPAYPPRNAKHIGRLAAIADDCGASAVLTTADLMPRLSAWEDSHLPTAIAIDTLAEDTAGAWRPANVRSADIAFLQYTSGTTGTPKGVMVGHDNLIANWQTWARGVIGRDDVLVSWLPPYHDLGLIGCILHPLMGGFLHVSMAPAAFGQNPRRWLEAMSCYRATITMAPNFAYELACDVRLDDNAAPLDLSTLRHAISGGEPPREATLDRFQRKFAPVGFKGSAFRPGYGLAEATLQVSLSLPSCAPSVIVREPDVEGGNAGRRQTTRVVSNGPVIDGHDLRIVDPDSRLERPAGEIGEIWVSGPAVALGYWNRPDQTAETFGARLAGDVSAGPFLRSGDLGTLVQDELYVLGRIKELVIVRGTNHYVQDIEATVAASDPAIGSDSTIAFGIEHSGEEKVVIVVGLNRGALRTLDAPVLLATIRGAVVDGHDLDPHAIVLVRPASLPRTSSGKLQRILAREMFVSDALAVVAGWTKPQAQGPSSGDPQGLTALRQRLAMASAGDRVSLLRHALAERIRQTLELPAAPDLQAGFADLGFDSLKAVQFGNLLNVELALDPPLPATVLFDHPNIEALVRLLGQRLGLPADESTTRPKTPTPPRMADASIAVVGLAARVPGGADAAAFWKLLASGLDAVVEVPRDRFDIDAWYDSDPDALGKIYARSGGFLDRVDRFDAGFFGISPREATSMDPQQRLLLETAWQALEDAGIAPERLSGSDTAVFVGVSTHDYADLLKARGSDAIDAYLGTGTAHSVVAGRLSYVLGLQGPAVAIDTACSSSLVAVHQACWALRNHECDAALAGGVNVILSPEITATFCRARMLSPDGRCKTFDAAADGYGRGEGVGIVVLKRLADAERDRDRILAVIRGSAVNQDGASGGLTVPSGPAQERLILAALAQAGVAPSEIVYLETHGTGTSLGDPIEVQAAARALGCGRPADRPLLLGSAKAAIGHLEAAAGIAGLIKVVLALGAGELPSQPNFSTPNPHIAWDELPVAVMRERRAWPDGRRIAGVSSFGFSGTNAHVVLEGYAGCAEASPAADPSQSGPKDQALPERVAHVLPLSAKSRTALTALAGRYGAWLNERASIPLGDVCFTAGVGRSHFAHRAAIVADTREDLLAGLSAVASGSSHPSIRMGQRNGSPRVGVLFTGQASQRSGMGQGLYAAVPGFRDVVDRCASAVDGLGLQAIPLLDVMFAAAGSDLGRLLDDTGYAQPALYALQCGLWALWRNVGIEASALLGHSLGEYAAAQAAGVFELEDGARLVARRGALMSALPAGGAMAAVFAPPSAVSAALTSVNAASDEVGVSLAAENGTHVVVSGPAALVDAVVRQFEVEGVRCARLTVSHAFHSGLLDPMLDRLEQAASEVAHRPPAVTLIGNLSGEAFAPGTAPNPMYWRRHAREAVRFGRGVASLAGAGIDVLLEVGPQAVLGPLALDNWPDAERPALVASLRAGGDEERCVAEALAGLYSAGGAIDFGAWDAGRMRARIALPSYPFEPVRHWMEPPRRLALEGQPLHPLLGTERRSADGSVTWTQELSATEPSWATDHAVFGSAVVPGALYACLAAASGALPLAVRDGQIAAPLVLDEPAVKLQLMLGAPDAEGVRSWRVFALPADAVTDVPWRLHASGTVAPMVALPVPPAPVAEPLVQRDVAAFYATMARLGIGYGPNFRGIARLWAGAGVARGEIAAPEGLAGPASALRPAVLDACLQVVAAALPEMEAATDPHVPVGWEAVELWAPVPVRVVCEAHLRDGVSSETAVADLWLRNAADGATFGRVAGLALKRATRQALLGAAEGVDELLYETVWREVARAGPAEGLVAPETAASASARSGAWLLLGDVTRVAALRGVLAGHGVMVLSGVGNDAESLLAAALTETAALGTALAGVAWLASAANAPSAAATEAALAPPLGLAKALIGAGVSLPGGLVLATARAVATAAAEDADPLAAALWGFGRVLQAEQPSLAARLLDAAEGEEEALVAALLGGGSAPFDTEPQLAHRDGTWLAPRLLPARQSGRLKPPPGDARIEIGAGRTLEGLALVALPANDPACGPEPGAVAVSILAAGLNFRDVLNALGLYPGDAGLLGSECAGIVTAAGAGVSHLAVGDPVFGFAPGTFATRCTAPAALMRRLPDGLDAAAAASLPTTFCTALAAFDLTGLSANDRVLIHAGAGGVGLAAIQLAQAVGAEVFATASTAKRDHLRRLGVRHVFDSRDLSFAADVLKATGRRGVDVVLNSLTGEGFIEASLSALAAGGRFVEIAKRNIWTAARMAAARADAAYHIFALDDWVRDAPERVGALLDRVVAGLASGVIRPLSRRCYTLTEAPAAMRLMQRAGHVGKIVLTADRAQPRADGTYLVTGGLGAMGLAAADWLAGQGAGRLVLAGRRPPSAEAAAAIAGIAARTGCAVTAVQADMGDAASVQSLVAGLATDALPLRGVIHAAGVLDDGVITSQSWARFAPVLAAKLLGGWYLHRATEGLRLDFFVLYSSAAGILGSAGQASYAAANAGLDALAQHRRALGLPATSVAWGPRDTGMAATGEARANLTRRGMRPLRSDAAHRALAALLRTGSASNAVLDADWPKLRRHAGNALAALLAVQAPARDIGGGDQLHARLADMSASEGRALIRAWLGDALRSVLRLPQPPEDNVAFGDLGLDSLMAVELRNQLNTGLRIDPPLPATLLFDRLNLAALTELVLEKLRHAETAAASSAAADTDEQVSGRDRSMTVPKWCDDIPNALDRLYAARAPRHSWSSVAELVVAFRKSDGALLQRDLEGVFRDTPESAYFDLYRDAYLARRDCMPFDPAAQVGAMVVALEGAMALATVAERCGALVAALMIARSRLRAEADVDRADPDPTYLRHMRESLTTIRRLGPDHDSLVPLRRDSSHVVIFHAGEIFEFDVGTATPEQACQIITRAVSDLLSMHYCSHRPNPIAAQTAADKREAAQLRRMCEADAGAARTVASLESAWCILVLDPEGGSDPSTLQRLTMFGRGSDRWYGQYHLVIYRSAFVGTVMDHATLDALTGGRLAGELVGTAQTFAVPRDGAGRIAAPAPNLLPLPPDAVIDLLRGVIVQSMRRAAEFDMASAVLPHVPRSASKTIANLYPIAIARAGLAIFGAETDIYSSVSLAHFVGGRVTGVRARPPATSRLLQSWAVADAQPDSHAVLEAMKEWEDLHQEAARGTALYTHLVLLSHLSRISGRGQWFFEHPWIHDLLGWPSLVSSGVLSTDRRVWGCFPCPKAGIGTVAALVRSPAQTTAEVGLMAMSDAGHAKCFIDIAQSALISLIRSASAT